MKSIRRTVFLILFLMTVTSCGGGGESKVEPVAPSLSASPILTVNENENYSFSVVAVNFDSSNLNYSASNLPSWAQIDHTNGKVSGTPTYNDAGIYTAISISASNGTQTATLPSFSIEVININRAPKLLFAPRLSVSETELYQHTFEVIDEDGDDFTFTLKNIPDWASYDSDTFTLAGVPTLSDAGFYENISVVIEDGTEIANFTITVKNSIVVSGKVFDGYISGATVFLDNNLNSKLDENELSTTSDISGEFSLTVTADFYDSINTSPIRAYIGNGASDTSRPDINFNETPITLSGLPLTSLSLDAQSFDKVFISPFTHRVISLLENELIQLFEGEISVDNFDVLLNEAKESVFINVFSDLEIDILTVDLDLNLLKEDVFGDFLTSEVYLPITFQRSIITLAEGYTDNYIEFQDYRDTDNDGIPNNQDNDDDGDGVSDEEDAYRLDVSEAYDSDGDGVGNNADFYPNDKQCWNKSDGNEDVCYFTWLANQEIQSITNSPQGIVYFLVGDEPQILIYDSKIGHFETSVNALGVTSIEYVDDHQRLYTGHNNGDIKYLSDSFQFEIFNELNSAIKNLKSVGRFLYGLIGTGEQQEIYLINSEGEITDSLTGLNGIEADEQKWVTSESQLYFINNGLNNVAKQYIDQSSGLFGEIANLPELNKGYSASTPMSVSNYSNHIILGNGIIYDKQSLGWVKATGLEIKDAYWENKKSLITFHNDSGKTRLIRRDQEFKFIDDVLIEGSLQAILHTSDGVKFILKDFNDEHIFIEDYLVNNDKDGDGVINADDAFPNDLSASVDTDNDGYPDLWNDGYSQYDSSLELSLDSFPLDAACWSLEQGSSGTCDIASLIPSFNPDQIAYGDNGTVYLLDKNTKKIYLWNVESSSYLSPFYVNSLLELQNTTARKLTFSSKHNRLYVGYSSGLLTYFDLDEQNQEYIFSKVPGVIYGLSDAGDFIFVQDLFNHYVFDKNGYLTDSKSSGEYSQSFQWSSELSRIYYLRDGTDPNDLSYSTIEQEFGVILSSEDSPYHSSIGMQHPIKTSHEGTNIILGSGKIYDVLTLINVAELESEEPLYLKDQLWTMNDIFTLEEDGGKSVVKIWSVNDYHYINKLTFAGKPIAFISFDTGFVVMTRTNEGVSFSQKIHIDKDGDGLPGWWEVKYSLDDEDDSDARIDSDNDGLANIKEYFIGTNPLLSDSDNDGLSDGQEVRVYFTNPLMSDTDKDGLSDSEEVIKYKTDPIEADTDKDGIEDGAEVNEYETDPLSGDSDSDGLSDYNEIFIHKSNPLAEDTDEDGISDKYEVDHFLNINEDDAQLDNDLDELVNLDEFIHGTDPHKKDSDIDGIPDGYEVINGLNPILSSDAWLDYDNDDHSNIEEYYYGTDLRDVSSFIHAKPWQGYQGNSKHNGFMPITIDFGEVNLKWSIEAYSLQQQVISDLGKVFVVNNTNNENWLSAHNILNGEEIWRKHYNESSKIVTPALNLNRVYIQTKLNGDALIALDVNSGEEIYRQDYGWGDRGTFAPVPYKESVYSFNGWNEVFGYSFLGEQNWSYWLDYVSHEWTPAVNENYIFTLEKGLKIINRFTGGTLAKINLPSDVPYDDGEGFNSSYKYNSPVIGSLDNVLAVQSNHLINYDIKNKSVLWYTPITNNRYQKQVTVADGNVYAIHNNSLSVFNESTGALLWNWQVNGLEYINSNIIATNNVILLSTNFGTYAIEISSRKVVWQTLETGQLSLSSDGVLFIAGSVRLYAYDMFKQ